MNTLSHPLCHKARVGEPAAMVWVGAHKMLFLPVVEQRRTVVTAYNVERGQ